MCRHHLLSAPPKVTAMTLNNLAAPAFIAIAEFSCRICGGEHIPSAEKFDLCAACFAQFSYFLRCTNEGKPSVKNLNLWLGKRLLRDAQRLQRTGVTGRCEALGRGSQGWRDPENLTQCRCRATSMREGRRVCGRHATAARCVWFGDKIYDAYRNFESVMTELAKTDARFRACLASALRESA